MLRVTLAGLRAHTVRLFLTGLVVVLSIGFTAGTLVLTDSLDRAGTDRVAASAAGVDLAVMSPDEPGGSDGGDAFLPGRFAEEIGAVDGVAAAGARREVAARTVDADGRVEAFTFARMLAVPTDPDLAALDLSEGRGPAADGEVVLDTRTAERAGVGIGDAYMLAVVGAESPETFAVVGLAEPSALAGDQPEVHATFADVQAFAETPGAARVDIRLEGGADGDAVAAAMRRVTEEAGLDGAAVITGAQLTQRLLDESTSLAGELRIPLLMLGAVALLVAAFVVANTFRILVAQRARELALLRTVGATRRQVRSGVLLESAAVGLAGSLAGVLLGASAAFTVGSLVDDGAGSLPVAVTPSTVVWSVAVGLAVTVGSAVLPARVATRVSPLEAVRAVPDGVETHSAGRRRLVGGLAVMVAGAALMAAGVAVAAGVGLVAVVFGAAICFLGLLILGSRIMPPALRALGAVLARWRPSRTTTRLATANAVRNPRRAAATSGALLIAMTMVTGFLAVAESARASVDVVLDRQIPADFLVRTAVADGVPARAVAAIGELPETGVAVELYQDSVTVDGLGTIEVAGLDLAGYERIAGAAAEGLDEIGPGEVVLDPVTARDHGLAEGDTITVDTADGSRPLEVGLVADGGLPVEGMVVTPEVFRQLSPDVDSPEQLAVDVAEGVAAEDARAAMVAATARMPDVSVTSFADTRSELNDQLDQAVGVVLAILGLAVVIAAIGIANTMSLSVHERTSELGLLRALGQTRRQTRAMLGVEAVLISIVAAVLGAVVGVVFAWAAVMSLEELVFVVPWAQVAACGVAAGGLGLLASVVPGRRAARVAPVVALAAQ